MFVLNQQSTQYNSKYNYQKKIAVLTVAVDLVLADDRETFPAHYSRVSISPGVLLIARLCLVFSVPQPPVSFFSG